MTRAFSQEDVLVNQNSEGSESHISDSFEIGIFVPMLNNYV